MELWKLQILAVTLVLGVVSWGSLLVIWVTKRRKAARIKREPLTGEKRAHRLASIKPAPQTDISRHWHCRSCKRQFGKPSWSDATDFTHETGSKPRGYVTVPVCPYCFSVNPTPPAHQS